jgi:hypothetical protein
LGGKEANAKGVMRYTYNMRGKEGKGEKRGGEWREIEERNRREK